MEFTIDVAAIRMLLADENKTARKEIAELDVVEAYRRSTRRHDARLASASDAQSLACGEGCSWCCHFSVDVRPVEVFNILEFMRRELSASELARVQNEIQANSLLLKQLNDTQRAQRNIKCAFLNEGRCTIYAARPQTCRNYHATNVAGCKQSFDEPDNFEIDPEFAPGVYQAGGAHVDAFSTAMQDAGYDIAAYELHSALMAAIENYATAYANFMRKDATFPHLPSVEVPSEFSDLDD